MRKGRSAAPLTSADAPSALATLERWAADGDRALIVLVGAANAGKTVLLDVLAARLVRYFSVVYLSRSGSDPDELSARILAALGDATQGTPRLVLAREIERRRADKPLVLFLDDADTLPPRVELWLFDLARRSAGALRIVLALSDARLAREFADAFRAGTEIVSIDKCMAKDEAESYLQLLAARASGLGSGPHRVDDSATVRPPSESVRAPAALARVERPEAPSSSAPRRKIESPQSPPPSSAPTRGAPRAPAASAREARKGPRWRWIALAAALLISFVAGFFLSELRGTPVPALVETAEVQPAAELPSVSAPMPLESPQASAALPSAPATESAAPRVPASDAAGRAALATRADPFSPRMEAEALLPVERGEPAAAAADENAFAVRAPVADEEQLLDTTAPAPAPAAIAEEGEAAPRPPAPAPDSGNQGGAVAIAAAGDPAPRGESSDVSAAPPSRPRLVEVRVQVEPGAEIWIGDRALGGAPVGAVSLPPGAHRLRVRLSDGREVERVVEVRGSRYEIQVR